MCLKRRPPPPYTTQLVRHFLLPRRARACVDSVCIKRVVIALSLGLSPHMDAISLSRYKASSAYRACFARGVLASKRVYAWRPIDGTTTATATQVPAYAFCERVIMKAALVRSIVVQAARHATSLTDDVGVRL